LSRVIFFGTPELSVPTLRALHDAGHEIVLVISQADKRRGRSSKLSPSPVKAAALELGLPVTARVKDVLDVQADVGVLVAFGRVIRPEILDYLTIINLHPSLLPRWRGATPVEATIMAGDPQTGICLMQLAEEMDAGPIYKQWKTPVVDEESASLLYERLFAKGNELLIDLLQGPLPEPVPQTGEATYCGKLTPEDFHIDWSSSAEHIHRLARTGKPWTTFRGKRVQVLEAKLEGQQSIGNPGELMGTEVETGDGVLTLVRVQPEGKGAMDARSWANGLRLNEEESFL
jgi:methionyl-tRNA formyltransferase